MEGIKFDKDKIRMELIPMDALEEMGKVLTYGAKKYEDHNWCRIPKWSRQYGACLRHIAAWGRREDKDPETGISHLAHAGCCIMFLLAHELRGTGYDDRYTVAEYDEEGTD